MSLFHVRKNKKKGKGGVHRVCACSRGRLRTKESHKEPTNRPESQADQRSADIFFRASLWRFQDSLLPLPLESA
ncbi:hypothetical protein psal_cds_457 [Pandoravirus salinus]|uniref:Uncharacterized protein n=1 Tax=Pandoravirus salinus TaxID=1349410 RepID=A0A291ATR5_9VIRU|nr:hypothetical protein psal_cds_457 [Pandoravirus salinus]ATE82179.1 hypothetical protein psal_cds_457 [Pandoravirus salinus]